MNNIEPIPAPPTLATLPDVQAALHREYLVSTRGVRVAVLSNGTDTGGNSRIALLAPKACFDLSILFSGFNGDSPVPNPYVVRCALEYPEGTFYPLTFGGLRDVTVQPGQIVKSDMLPLDLPAGASFFLRTFVSVLTGGTGYTSAPTVSFAGGGGTGAAATATLTGSVVTGLTFAAGGLKWPTSFVPNFSSDGGVSGTTQTDMTTSGTVPNNFAFFYSPLTILGRLAVPAPSVLIIGDSIAAGQGDTGNSTGFIVGGLGGPLGTYVTFTAAGIPYMNLAQPGETAASFAGYAARPMRSYLFQFARYAVCEYGANDLLFATTLAALQANSLIFWKSLALRGVSCYQTTLTPRVTSSDNFATLAGQTPINSACGPGVCVRTLFNDWVRAGAPLVAGVAVAAGTAGALVAGQPGHPLTGYFEVADRVESSRNSGTWALSPAFVTGTFTGVVSLGNYAFNLTDSSKTWTPSQFNDWTLSFTAGTSSSGHTNMAFTVLNSNTLTVKGVTPNPDTTTQYQLTPPNLTLDGTHPSAYGHYLMSQAINVATFK